MTEHERMRNSLGAFALGQLPPEEQAAVRVHLTECARCRAEAADLLSVAGSLAHVDPDNPLPTPPAHLNPHVKAVLTDLHADQSKWRRLPAAAVGVLGKMMRNRRRSSPSP